MVSGLAMTFIEAPEKLQQVLRIPEDHLQVCRDGGVPTRGNAAGNEQNLLDLSGAIVSPPPLPAG
jgi:iron transport multicopper oxidase